MPSLIPTGKIIERLRYENPWWVTKEVPKAYSSMSKRLYFDLFYPFVNERSIRVCLNFDSAYFCQNHIYESDLYKSDS